MEEMAIIESSKLVDEEKIQDCINDSFENKGDLDSNNKILQADK